MMTIICVGSSKTGCFHWELNAFAPFLWQGYAEKQDGNARSGMLWALPWLRSDVWSCGYKLYHSPWGLETKPSHYLSSMGSLGVLTSTAIRVGGGQITSINISSEKLKKQKSLYPPMYRECCLKYTEWLGLHIRSWTTLSTGAENYRSTMHEGLLQRPRTSTSK